MWDYGSLDEHQEKEYINAKMRMINAAMDDQEVLLKHSINVIKHDDVRH